jgi:putative membrane protein
MSAMAPVVAQMMDRDQWHGGGHGWGWLIGLAVLVLLVGLTVWAVIRITQSRATPPGAAAPPPRRSAEAVLADRLARGEIDADEYRKRLAVLRES